MNNKVVILDDESDIISLVSINLKKYGYETKGFTETKDFREYLKAEKPCLIILDLMLPDADGFEICRSLKQEKEFAKIPVIMLSARDQELDKVFGLELGADDYITKPFSTRELVARVKAVLRRYEKVEITEIDPNVVKIGNISINSTKHEVLVDNKTVNLTSTEFKLLLIMSKRQGWVFSRDKLLDQLWGNDKTVIDRTIDVHIKHLREKLGDAGEMIKNIRGIGYKLEVS